MSKIISIPVTAERSDAELLDQFKLENDQDALAHLYLRYSDLIYGVCLKYLEDPEDAKDAVMNIYQEIREKLPRHEVQHFKSWLYVLAKNHCLMILRAAKKNITVNLDTQVVQSGDLSHLDSVIEKEETFKKLEKCMESLPGEQERTIRLFYYENKCYNEIAETTGMEWNKVRSLIQNGRRNLKNCMDKNVN
ncbi:RNA polymerase sigma factor [Niabella drilacis]|uniref:RNA polymerase sigma-70 factor, ECF subfamily n=1 Tax=Niabella drilacis (strain DSM 25811 / CCM 8410 / CCUG 62505 / LMG 26954 / E90) TaxID=1285928 RepID=A0A1G6ZGZ5_NIADE|nr:sigma-70 family RNA polymerase sigma factor [Niabella drilacis]SDE01928.1 RNA polymerase sigma-70 factor, ECF subfamily [Niabella drilacis]